MLEDSLNPGTPISWSLPDGPGSGDLLYSMFRGFGGDLLSAGPPRNRNEAGVVSFLEVSTTSAPREVKKYHARVRIHPCLR